MKVVYSGCQWNQLVFQMDNNQSEFENWIDGAEKWLDHTIFEDPAKFKVRMRHAIQSMIRPSKNPELYPPELRTKLATARRGKDVHDAEVTATIECNGERVDPSQVWSGSYITPVFRMSYYKDGDDYGLSLTVLKGDYEPCIMTQIPNDAWMIDANTSGSDSSSGDAVAVAMEEGFNG